MKRMAKEKNEKEYFCCKFLVWCALSLTLGFVAGLGDVDPQLDWDMLVLLPQKWSVPLCSFYLQCSELDTLVFVHGSTH